MMVKDGLFERCPMEMVFGLHNWPQARPAPFLWRVGPMMAAVAYFEITITGRGTHGASPHLGVDPIVVSPQIVIALQTIVSRRSNRSRAASLRSAASPAATPTTSSRAGDDERHRPLVPAEVGDQMEDGMRRLATGIAESFGAKAEVKFFRHAPATVNDADANVLRHRGRPAVAGQARVQPMRAPTMGGEDFAFMLEAKQGAYMMLGAAGPATIRCCIIPATISTMRSCRSGRHGGRRWWSGNWRSMSNFLR